LTLGTFCPYAVTFEGTGSRILPAEFGKALKYKQNLTPDLKRCEVLFYIALERRFGRTTTNLIE
ncbi:MAG: hypothetical protein V3S51_08205, partial [Dehalococcoidia bacterium]